MNIACLALDASTDQLSVAACNAERVAVWETQSARGESQRVFTHAARVLEEVELTLQDLDCVAFGCGPGSFTGVRIAAATAQSIAFALSIPVCRQSSLALLAAGAIRRHRTDFVGVCLDARMGRAYFALYRSGNGGPPLPVIEDCVIDPMTYVPENIESFLAVGMGWAAYPQLHASCSGKITATDISVLPSARDLLRMAVSDLQSGATVSAGQALPNYLTPGPVSLPEA